VIAKKIGPIALLIPLVAALGGCAKAPPSEQAIARVDRQVSDALRKATGDMDKTIAANPNDARALARRGMLYLGADDDAHAQADFDAALRIDPANATGHYGRAVILDDHGRYTEAIVEYDLSIATDPRAYASLNARGLAYWHLDKFDAAIDDFTRAISVSDSPLRTSEALENRGMAYRDKDDPDRALQDYDAALKAYPTAEHVQYNRAVALADKHAYDAAIDAVNIYIRSKPSDADGWRKRGWIYLQTGRPDLALPDLGQAIKLDPNLAIAYRDRAAVYAKTGQAKLAEADLKTMRELQGAGAQTK